MYEAENRFLQDRISDLQTDLEDQFTNLAVSTDQDALPQGQFELLATRQRVGEVLQELHETPERDRHHLECILKTRLGHTHQQLDALEYAIEDRRLSAPYAVKGGWAPIFCQVTNLFGMEDGLVALLTRPLVIEATVAHILDFYLDVLQRVHDACEGHLDFAPLGDDFADQRRLLVSPELWRRIFWTGLYQAV